jgi:hypothetical protein
LNPLSSDYIYMARRLRLLSEGRELVGTPEEYIKRHEQALVDLLRLRAPADINLDR